MGKLRCGVFASIFLAALAANAEDGAASNAELQRLYRQFFQQKDNARLGTLVYWRGVDQESRDGFFRSINADFKYDLRNVRLLPLDPNERIEYTSGGVTYVPALPPVGRMTITYQDRDNVKTLSTSYLVGAKAGRLYIDLAVKKSR